MKNLNNFPVKAFLQRGKGTLKGAFETSHLFLLLAARDVASQ